MSHLDPSKRGRITLFHIFVVVMSLSLTIAAWQFSKKQLDNRVGLRFEASRDQVLALITERMAKYEDALWAGVAAVKSHDSDISYPAWHEFARTLRIEERYPGINGIGIIHVQMPDEIDGYLARQRIDRPDFDVFPEHNQPFFMPITFIEPEDTNAAAIGLDVAHEANRRTAALLSRDTGLAQITGPIKLVQDAGHTPGFLFYAPFYRGGAQRDVAARRNAFAGAVYAPFVVQKLMDGLLSKDLRHVRFSIMDDDELIYDEHSIEDPMTDASPMFSEKISLNLYGRNWILDMRSDLAFRQDNAALKPTIILVAGLVIEGFIVALLFMMARANSRAVAYADIVTQRLKEKSVKLAQTNDQLSEKNEQLEQYAYVASHDLKTPIRGIGGLTEMIQEDLEDYFNSADANPDVQQNLCHILERVERMHQLTGGILQFFQIVTSAEQDEPLDLRAFVAGLRVDFGLSDDQVVLKGDCKVIDIDTVNFRGVLENLIGNAIKYHDGAKPLEISVEATKSGDHTHVSVSDNGPGIDPKFHARIFDVFQTLRRADTPESTGIGLAIVKKSIERHGKSIQLKSSLGNGAMFSFDWPTVAGANLNNATIQAA